MTARALIPAWWFFEEPRKPRKVRKPTEEWRTYSDGHEYVRRDRRGRVVEHVVCRAGHPYVCERYEYRNGGRVVVERDGAPVEEVGEEPTTTEKEG